MTRKRGVSLTEMLVCLVIIAVLVGFLSPVFSGAKSKAKNVVDVSNMRQLYAAMKLYEADNEGYPLRGKLKPFYDNYMGGTKLVCTSGANNPDDYVLYGYHDLLLEQGWKQAFDYYEECRKIRQGEFPLVQDLNHLSSRLEYEGKGRYILVVRESGQFQHLLYEASEGKLNTSPPATWPCPNDTTSFLDINY